MIAFNIPRMIKLALTAVLMMFSLSAQAKLVLLDEIVAVVNDDVVLASQLNNRLDEIKQRYASNPGLLPPPETLKNQVLDVLILESIQTQLAQQNGLQIPDAEINEALSNFANSQRIDLQQLQNRSPDQYLSVRNQIETQMLISRVQQRMVGSRVQVNPGEVDAYLDSQSGRAATAAEMRLAYVKVDDAAEAEAIVNSVNDGESLLTIEGSKDLGFLTPTKLPTLFRNQGLEELEAGDLLNPIKQGDSFHLVQLLEKRRSQVQLIDQVRARHILIKPNLLLSDEQARSLAENLREQILDGGNFAELAQEHSADLGSKAQGGELDWADPGTYVPEFKAMIEEMPLNTLSPVFKTDFGYHFLEVLGRRQQDISQDELKNKTAQALYQNKFQEELQRWLAEIRQSAYVDKRI